MGSRLSPTPPGLANHPNPLTENAPANGTWTTRTSTYGTQAPAQLQHSPLSTSKGKSRGGVRCSVSQMYLCSKDFKTSDLSCLQASSPPCLPFYCRVGDCSVTFLSPAAETRMPLGGQQSGRSMLQGRSLPSSGMYQRTGVLLVLGLLPLLDLTGSKMTPCALLDAFLRCARSGCITSPMCVEWVCLERVLILHPFHPVSEPFSIRLSSRLSAREGAKCIALPHHGSFSLCSAGLLLQVGLAEVPLPGPLRTGLVASGFFPLICSLGSTKLLVHMMDWH